MLHISPELIDPDRNRSVQVSQIVDTLVQMEIITYDIGRTLFEEWVVLERFDETVANEANSWLESY